MIRNEGSQTQEQGTEVAGCGAGCPHGPWQGICGPHMCELTQTSHPRVLCCEEAKLNTPSVNSRHVEENVSKLPFVRLYKPAHPPVQFCWEGKLVPVSMVASWEAS